MAEVEEENQFVMDRIACLPATKLVTCLYIKYQERTAMQTASVEALLSRFPNLRTFSHMLKRATNEELDQLSAISYVNLIRNLPRHVPYLKLFIMNEYQEVNFDWRFRHRDNSNRTIHRQLADMLHHTSQRHQSLTQISADGVLEADHYFLSPRMWDRVECLRLSSRSLDGERASTRQNFMKAAGHAVAMMPRLLRLFLEAKRYTYFLVYNRMPPPGPDGMPSEPRLCLMSRLQCARRDLSPEVLSVWQNVPRVRGMDRPLRVGVCNLWPRKKDRGDFILPDPCFCVPCLEYKMHRLWDRVPDHVQRFTAYMVRYACPCHYLGRLVERT
ncbi:hypothetical protein QBC47DRAFT_81551 [Echria macrotheca]|uniref:DUF6546 domain-containing protein n=1 Tax=Echria macrotheca TaxID=438768 RepID=A0AAJ0B4A4_9PEZI|nr:hypothetical protein QBC47DRAFT_81551 [Echria macrotheca]